MPNIINKLSEVTANQIAAGEVVQRPASVVKELMENAIDAEATAVIVGIKDGGCTQIQVIDDGCGMSHDDAVAAFERHATSKIKDSKDLFSIDTFGFRGEALPSIASVAEVELRTCQNNQELGTVVEINGGKVVKHTNLNSCVGTQFTIKNLFYNVPARRKFLKKPDSEARAVIAEFKKIALCYPKLSFILHHNDKCTFNLPITNLRKRVADVVGRPVSDKLMDLYAETPMVEIKGYVSTPSAAKRSPEQYMFINGRYFKSSYFNKAIVAAYENLLSSSEAAPQYFLYFKCDPSKVDVNVHPSKIEVKFEDENNIYQILNAAVRATLGKNGIMPMIDFDSSVSVDIPIFSDNGVLIKNDDNRIYNPNDKDFSFTTALFGGSKDDLEPVMDLDADEELELSVIQDMQFNGVDPISMGNVIINSFEKEAETINSSMFEFDDINSVSFERESNVLLTTSFQQNDFISTSFLDDNVQKEKVVQSFEDFISEDEINIESSQIVLENDESITSIYDENSTEEFISSQSFDDITDVPKDLFGLSDNDIPTGDVSKLGDRYILTSIAEDVYIVDIKRALSRIIYDRYSRKIKPHNGDYTIMSQKLMFPATISLQVSDRVLVDDCAKDLAGMGFVIEKGDIEGTVDITGVPIDMSDSDPYALFEEVLDSMRCDDNIGYNMDKRQRLISTLSTIATNQKFSRTAKEDMRYIVDTLRKSDNFSYTPTGKTIAVKIKMSDIKKLF